MDHLPFQLEVQPQYEVFQNFHPNLALVHTEYQDDEAKYIIQINFPFKYICYKLGAKTLFLPFLNVQFYFLYFVHNLKKQQ